MSQVYDIYARLSPNPEGDEKEAASVDRQVRELTAWVTGPLDGTVGDVYRDDGISATKIGAKRPGFEATLKRAVTRPMAVWHTDRYIRTTRDLLRVIDTGMTVHALHAGFLDLSTPAGIAVAKTVTAWAEYEGQQKALRQVSKHLERVSEGKPFLGGSRPFGYDKGAETYAVRLDEAEALREVYRNILAGASLGSQAEVLNSRGLTTPHGKPFRGSTLRPVLLHPRNAGILSYNGEEVGKGNWPAIVPEETFRAVVRALSKPSRHSGGPRLGRGGRTALLTGLAVCGECDRTVRVQYRGGKRDEPGSYRIYLCPNGHASAHADVMDDAVRDLIVAALSSDPKVLARMGAPDVTDEDVATLREELDRKRRKADEIQAMYDEDEITRPEFLDMRARNNERIEGLKRQLAEVGFGESVAGLLSGGDVQATWDNERTVNERHAIARQFFEEIKVLPRGRAANSSLPAKAEFWSQGRCLLALGA